MISGPMQLLLLGFDGPEFSGEIKDEVARLRDNEIVRLVDVIVVEKEESGDVALLAEIDLPVGDSPGTVAALIGLAELDSEVLPAAVDKEAVDDTWTVDDLLPMGTAVAIALIEHRWTGGLHAAVTRAEGTVLADTWISPADIEMVERLSVAESDVRGSLRLGDDRIHSPHITA